MKNNKIALSISFLIMSFALFIEIFIPLYDTFQFSRDYQKVCDSLYTDEELKRIIPIDSSSEYNVKLKFNSKIFKDLNSDTVLAKFKKPNLNFSIIKEDIDRILIATYFWIWKESTMKKKESLVLKEKKEIMRLVPNGGNIGIIYKNTKMKMNYENDKRSWYLVTLKGWIDRNDIRFLQRDSTGIHRATYSTCNLPITSQAVGNIEKRKKIFMDSSSNNWAIIMFIYFSSVILIFFIIPSLFRYLKIRWKSK